MVIQFFTHLNNRLIQNRMKQYYYSNGSKQFGPYSLEELKDHQITMNTLMWYDGLSDWTKACQIDEIALVIKVSPPPLAKPPSFKHDNDYKEDEEVATIGFLLLVLTIVGYFALRLSKPFGEWVIENRPLLLALSSIIKVGVTIWSVKVAKRQNRNTVGWGVFAFFLPSICLIILGQLKKLRKI